MSNRGPALNAVLNPAASPRARTAPGADEVLRGIGCMVLAVLLFAVMDAIIKHLARDYGTFQIMFFRSLFALAPVGVMVARTGGLAALRTRRPGGHVLRATMGAGATFCFFYSFGVLPLADAYAIVFAAPLFLTALSAPMLGESVGPRRWTAVILGFAGVLVMLRPGAAIAAGGAAMAPAALVCLAGAFLYAFALAFMRKLSRTETTSAIVVYFTLTCAAVGGIGMLFDWTTPAGAADFAMLACTGLIGGVAQILITTAFRLAPVAVVGPFDYTAMVWGVLFGWLFFGDLPGIPVVLGSFVVMASGLYILHRETRTPAGPAER
jgi:drug/metabolite transporter (DMT)-like permease